MEIALGFGDGGERLRMPDGGHGNVLVGKDEDVEAADERVGGGKLVLAVKCWSGDGEVEEAENLKAVVGLDVGDGVCDVGRRRADVEANPVGLREALHSSVHVECDVSTVDGEVMHVDQNLGGGVGGEWEESAG